MRLKLKGKLTVWGLIIVFLTVSVSTVVTSFIIRRQNRNQAVLSLKNALLVVQDTFRRQSQNAAKLMEQVGTRPELGEAVKFYGESKGNEDASTAMEAQFLDLTKGLYDDLRVGGLHRISLYDHQGELMAFAAQEGGNVALGFGFTSEKGRGFKVAKISDDKHSSISLKDFSFTTDLGAVNPRVSGKFPNTPKGGFTSVNGLMAFKAQAPVLVTDYETQGEEVREVRKTVGMVQCIKLIGKPVLDRLFKLTGTRINVFTGTRLAQGLQKDYRQLDPRVAQVLEKDPQTSLLTEFRPFIRDLELGESSYIEGLCSLTDEEGWKGAVSVLYPTEVFKKNTFEMLKALCVVSLVCLLLMFPLTLVLGGSIAKPISKIAAVLESASLQVASASAQVSTASQSLAEGSSKQSASLEVSASSLERLLGITTETAMSAKEADDLTESVTQSLQKANTSMKSLIEALEEISEASGNVSDIVKTISDIAFQTNLLALNAAVEAARAGELGSGFAVVADEVRNLAMRSAEASQNTQQILEAMVGKITKGSELVRETDERYRQVAVQTKDARNLMKEISQRSEEQADTVGQVNDEVQKMNAIVQETAAQAQETASASAEMKAQAKQLEETIEKIVSIVGKIQNGSKAEDNSHH